jgi:hypothetical protein
MSKDSIARIPDKRGLCMSRKPHAEGTYPSELRGETATILVCWRVESITFAPRITGNYQLPYSSDNPCATSWCCTPGGQLRIPHDGLLRKLRSKVR